MEPVKVRFKKAYRTARRRYIKGMEIVVLPELAAELLGKKVVEIIDGGGYMHETQEQIDINIEKR